MKQQNEIQYNKANNITLKLDKANQPKGKKASREGEKNQRTSHLHKQEYYKKNRLKSKVLVYSG